MIFDLSPKRGYRMATREEPVQDTPGDIVALIPRRSQERIRTLRAGRGQLWTRLESRWDEPDQCSGHDVAAAGRTRADGPDRDQTHDVRLSSVFYSRHYHQRKTQSLAHENRDTRRCIDDYCGSLKIIIIDSRCRVHASLKAVCADLLWVSCKRIFHFVRQA